MVHLATGQFTARWYAHIIKSIKGAICCNLGSLLLWSMIAHLSPPHSQLGTSYVLIKQANLLIKAFMGVFCLPIWSPTQWVTDEYEPYHKASVIVAVVS